MQRLLILSFSIILISCSPIRKYQNIPEVRAWEKDIQQFEQLDKSEKYQENSVLFAGSSSIRLWTTLEKDMAPYPVIQRGYGGAKLSDFAVYAGRIFDNHPCKAIVIFIANDISGTDQDKSPQEVAALFRNVLKTIRKTHPETPVFWIAVTPTPLRWKVWPEIVNHIRFYNAVTCYWFGYADEKLSAKEYILKFSGQSFEDPRKYLEWYRKKYFGYDF